MRQQIPPVAILFVAIVGLALVASPVTAVQMNTGGDREIVFTGHVISSQQIVAKAGTGERILFAPSDDDDPAFRAAVVAAGAGVCDYYDARADTPTLGLLTTYDAVFTWPNASYSDDVGFGDELANYVDAGGVVILGTWSYPGPWNALGGRIVTSGYIPVSFTNQDNTPVSYNLDGTSCLFTGVDAYTVGWHDIDPTAFGGGVLDGSLTGPVPAAAYRPDFRVIYVNGTTFDDAGDFPELIATAASCGVQGGALSVPVPATSRVGLVVLIVLVALGGALLIARRLF